MGSELPPNQSGCDLIAAERLRQIEKERWSLSHDDSHRNGELAVAAACYAFPAEYREKRTPRARRPTWWPWLAGWWKPTPNDRVRELVKAGALIAAEIDRLQRIASPEEPKP